MYFLALDIGRKKTGLATGHAETGLARDWKVLPAADLLPFLLSQQKKHKWDAILVGLPLSKAGQMTEAAEQIKSQAQKLAEALGLPVYFQDEQLSSWQAREILREQGYKPNRIKELEDQMAAKLILQDFLASRANRV